MWRKVLRAIGCLGYLGMLAVVFALVAYVAFSQFVRRGVTPTPDVGGLGEGEAVALLADQGLEPVVAEDDERYDERVPAGHVLVQRPGPGTLVKRGSPVTIILSRGPQLLQVPRVMGDALQAAQVTLTAAGLSMGRILAIYSDDGKAGTVIGQRPAGGERAERNGRVDLFLARGSSLTWVMPDLVEQSYEDVRRFFEARGFRIGRVSFEVYSGLTPGTVLRQFPQAGHPLHRGDVIALTLAASELGGDARAAGSGAADAGSSETP